MLNLVRFCQKLLNHKKFFVQKCWTKVVLSNDVEPSNIPFPEMLNRRGFAQYYWTLEGFCQKNAEPKKFFIQNSGTEKVLPNKAEPCKVLSKNAEP